MLWSRERRPEKVSEKISLKCIIVFSHSICRDIIRPKFTTNKIIPQL